MPQDKEVGCSAHDYDYGDSDSIFYVREIADDETTQEGFPTELPSVVNINM